MEENAETRPVRSAPWENATPEEDRAYDQQVEFGNVEFENEVRNAVGPAAHDVVDADVADFLPGSWNLRGFYVPDEFEDDEEYREAAIERYGKVIAKADATLAADTVYAVGTRNANPALWGHEFLHRKNKKEGAGLGGGRKEEGYVRQFMGFRAETPDQWIRAVDMWRDHIMDRYDAPESMTLEEAEAHLKKALNTAASTFIDREAKALESRGNRPKDRKVFGINWESHLTDQKEALERRQKSWNIEDSIAYKKMLAEEAAKEAAEEGSAKALDDRIKALDNAVNDLQDKLNKMNKE